jgi:hypothetical protein
MGISLERKNQYRRPCFQNEENVSKEESRITKSKSLNSKMPMGIDSAILNKNSI